MSNRVLNLPNDVKVTVSQPYAEGHVMTAIEAEKFNNVYADAIRTVLMTRLKKVTGGPAFDAAAVSTAFQSYADGYKFSTRASGGNREARASVSAVEKEAHKIAKDLVLASIRNKGGNPKDYSAEQIAGFVEQVLEKKPEIREEASRRIESARGIAGDVLADLA